MGTELEGTRHLAHPAVRIAVLLGAVVASTGGTTVTKVAVGSQPCAEIGAYGSLWVANLGSASLSRVDPATNRVTGTVAVGASPCGLAAGAGAIWVDGYGTGNVERVDPRTLERTRRIASGPGVWDVAFDGRYVWADNNADGTVVKIDPRSNRVVRRIGTGGAPTGLAVAFGSLWVGSNGYSDRSFFRISLRSGAVQRITPGCLRPAYFAVDGAADPWVTCIGDGIVAGRVLRLDPHTNRVEARVTVGRNPGDGAIDDAGRVWIPNKLDGTVSRIDPVTNTVAETVRVGGMPFVINAAFGDVWVPDAAGSSLSRLHAG
jgi:YVTN family beta-propeller protein